MAAPEKTVWGDKVGDYCRIGIYTSQTSTKTETTVTVEVWFWSKYSCTDSGSNNLYLDNLSAAGSATSDKGGTNIATTSDSGAWSTTNQVKLTGKSYTYKHTRGTTDTTRYIYAKLTGINKVSGTAMYAETTVKVPALGITACSAPTSFTVTPNPFENVLTFTWAGATGGENNDIDKYSIRCAISADGGSSYGEWITVWADAREEGNTQVRFDLNWLSNKGIVPNRGDYLKFGIRTMGKAGDAYHSDWSDSVIVQKDNEPYVYIPNADLDHERHLSYIYDESIDPEQPFGKYMPYVFDGTAWQRHS